MNTWIDGNRAFDSKIWNHHNTIGPRTNNHVEGVNHKLNEFIDAKKHPDIYSLILSLNNLETEAKIQYMRVKQSNEPQKREEKFVITISIALWIKYQNYLHMDLLIRKL